MLHKVGVEDNTSFYAGKGGKSDFIINLVWHKDFDKVFQRHLSGVDGGKKLEGADEEKETETGNVSIDDCFKAFKE